MARRKPDTLRREKVDEGVLTRRNGAMDGLHHALVLLRAGDREHAGKCMCDLFRLCPQAAGHDHLPVLIEGLANGGKRLRLGAVEKAAGVDHDEIGAPMIAGKLIAFGAQPRNDTLAVDQRLGASERDEAHLGGITGNRSDIVVGHAGVT